MGAEPPHPAAQGLHSTSPPVLSGSSADTALSCRSLALLDLEASALTSRQVQGGPGDHGHPVWTCWAVAELDHLLPLSCLGPGTQCAKELGGAVRPAEGALGLLGAGSSWNPGPGKPPRRDRA